MAFLIRSRFLKLGHSTKPLASPLDQGRRCYRKRVRFPTRLDVPIELFGFLGYLAVCACTHFVKKAVWPPILRGNRAKQPSPLKEWFLNSRYHGVRLQNLDWLALVLYRLPFDALRHFWHLWSLAKLAHSRCILWLGVKQQNQFCPARANVTLYVEFAISCLNSVLKRSSV